MNSKTYIAYNDPGHGWLKVTRKELVDLKIEKKISHYSYQRGDHVYLEEDCDLSLFIAVKNSLGYRVVIKDQYSKKSSKIRSYDGYIA